MTICEFCGFDSEEADGLVANGSPCGVDGCPVLICCFEKWKEHQKLYHGRI